MEFSLNVVLEEESGTSPSSGIINIIFKAKALEDTDFYPQFTPLGGMVTDSFLFTADSPTTTETPSYPLVVYTGILPYRDDDKFQPVHMQKGEELQVKIDLSSYYSLEPGQEYQVKYVYGMFHKSKNDISIVVPASYEDTNTPRRMEEPQKKKKAKKGNKKGGVFKDLRPAKFKYNNCDAAKIDLMEKALYESFSRTQTWTYFWEEYGFKSYELADTDHCPRFGVPNLINTVNYMNFNFRFWFGALLEQPDEERYDQVKIETYVRQMRAIADAFSKPNRYVLECDPAFCFEGVEAYVFAAAEDNDCEDFFRARDNVVLSTYAHFSSKSRTGQAWYLSTRYLISLG
jgi:hypothetical protein